MKIGYSLSSEEQAPGDLVRYAKRAEEAGFSFALISDHYHPWIKRQGHSAFVWNVVGAVSQATERLILGTGVTCPTMRIHPTLIAQAAATAELMMPKRFFLGLGTGENLNEHILGQHWPPIQARQEMLVEAVAIIRNLWRGGNYNHRGSHFTVEAAQIFSLPDEPPPIMIAAAGPGSAALAGAIGDGLISTVPKETIVRKFRDSDSGREKPRYAQMTVCWAETESAAKKIAREWWPMAAIPGSLMANLATPAEFEAAAGLVNEDAVAAKIVCGPDPNRHLAQIHYFIEAGYDHVYVHQVGRHQDGFFSFYEREIIPRCTV